MTGLSRDQILQLSAEGRLTEFIEMGTIALSAMPDDLELRLALVRGLTAFGLLNRAYATASSFAPAIQAQPDFQVLLRQLAAPQNNGRAEWHQYESRFEMNLKSLADRVPWADAVRQAWNKLVKDYELHITRHGSFEVFDLSLQRWRPCFGMHAPEESFESIRRTVENRVITPIIVEGLALGAHVPIYVSATRDTVHTSSPYIFIVEPNYLPWAVSFALNDWSDALQDKRVVFCGGPDAYACLDREIEARPSAPVPSSVIRPPAWQALPADGGAQARVVRLKAANDKAVAEARAVAESAFASRDQAYWANRYERALRGDGPPLRVLAVTSRFTTVLQYATRDALQAIENAGCETRMLVEEDDHSYVAPATVLKAFTEFEPDLLFLIDHTRASQAVWAIDQIPVLSWIQDRLPWLFDRGIGLALGKLDFFMGHSKAELTQQYGYAAERFRACNMATDVALLTEQASIENPEQFDCEIAFASHASETPEAFTQTRLSECDTDATRAFVSGIAQELQGRFKSGVLNGAVNFDRLLKMVAAQLTLSLPDHVCAALIAEFARPLTERLLRQQTIHWAATWADAVGARFHIYGRGWEHHPEFARFARGEIPHGPALGEAFRRATINLHAGCNHALHQRVLDGLAAGGFFLVRRHAADRACNMARAMVNHVYTSGLLPPATIRCSELPAPWDTIYRHICRDKGTDPDAPLPLNERNFSRLNRVALACEEKAPDQIWPMLDDITFGSYQEFVERVEYHLANPQARTEVADEMRAPVMRYFSYDALMKSTLDWLADRLNEQPQRIEDTHEIASELCA